ncbi:MAG: V-type ATP synthase subunit I [Clostridia bacterium]
MSRISVLGLVHEKNQLLSRLMELGIVQINDVLPDEQTESGYSAYKDEAARVELEKKLSTLGDAIQTLAPLDERKKPMFKVQRDITKNDYMHIILQRHEVLRTAETVNGLRSDLVRLRNEVNKAHNMAEFLAPWKELHIPVDLEGTKTCRIYTGTLPSAVDMEGILSRSGELLYQMEVIHQDNEQYYVVAYVHRSTEREGMGFLKKKGFSQVSFNGLHGYAGDIITERMRKAETLAGETEEIQRSLNGKLHHLHALETVFDYYTIRKSLLEADGEVLKSKRVFIIDGWVPTEAAELVKKEIQDTFIVQVNIRNAEPGVEVPILVKNGPVGDSIQDVTRMYSLPNAWEIDPNKVTAFFFILFFGLMLSDGGYGLVMAGVCALLYFKVKMKDSMRRFIKLMMFCGMATVFWGALFGSWFGNLIPVLSGNPDMKVSLWFDPVKDPEYMLMWALLFGVVHLYVGIAMRGFNFIKQKKYLNVVFDVLFWYVFFTGAIFLVLPYVPAVDVEMARSLAPAGNILFVTGGILLILTQGRKKKGIFGKIFGGVASMYDLISFMSDILSYSRLLAMGLATSVIATIVNDMGAARGFDFLGIVIFILVFTIGHAFNFALNALGAYVHSSRLQYIEFFNKFYKGGGKAFQPFSRNTKYVNIKD